MRLRLIPIAACLGLLFLTGCVERTITVTSEPPGTLVYLNDEEIGRTPVTVPFTFYGTYDVRLQHEGCKPLWTQQETQAPWWEIPGPDLIAEMVPDVQIRQNWHFVLEPKSEPSPESLIDHAHQIRNTFKDQPVARPADGATTQPAK